MLGGPPKGWRLLPVQQQPAVSDLLLLSPAWCAAMQTRQLVPVWEPRAMPWLKVMGRYWTAQPQRHRGRSSKHSLRHNAPQAWK